MIFNYSDSIGSVRICKLLSDSETIAPSNKGRSISDQSASMRDMTSLARFASATIGAWDQP